MNTEQNDAGVAAGLATTGKIPFVVTYAVFGSRRMAEQIRQEICYTNLNVKIACSHGGLTPANDGASLQGIVKRIGIRDRFGEFAPYERLLAKNGITVENIVETAKALQK